MKTLRIIALAGVLSLVSASATLAQGPAAKQTWVTAADLDVTREAGAREFLKRVNRAAARMCGGPEIHASRQRAFKECRDATVADAVSSIASPMLTAVYRKDERAILFARK